MRRQRPPHKTFAFVAVMLGVVTVPTVARAASTDEAGPAPTAPANAGSAAQPDPDPGPPHTEPPRADPPPPITVAPRPSVPPSTDPPPTAPPATGSQPDATPSTEPVTSDAPPPDVAAPEPGGHGSGRGTGHGAVHEPATTVPSTSPTAPAATDAPAAAASGADQPGPEADVAGVTGITREIAFPVLGPVRYSDDFGACRDGCARHHQGNDILGVRMQPLLAAVDGTVTKLGLDGVGISGVSIRITGDDGWYYNYFHVNNDTPGTDDGRATPEWQVEPGLTVGSRVRAGQIIGYMGDSGNAEQSVPHLHFEIRMPDHTPVDPSPSLVAAQRREMCTPGTDAWADTPLDALSPRAVAVIPLADGGRWVIDADGRLHAEGPAAVIQPVAGTGCATYTGAPALTALAAPTTPATVAPGAPVAPPAPDPTPATTPPLAAAVAPTTAGTTATDDGWTVQPGDSLWHIVQRTYGVRDAASTAALVAFVFDHNRGQLDDPGRLVVGMHLVTPPLRF